MRQFTPHPGLIQAIVSLDSPRFRVTDIRDRYMTLYPGKQTRGHSHKDQEEVYIFTKGSGYINLDGKEFLAKEGDVFTIKAKVHHQVRNPHPEFALHFLCVFEGKRNH